MKKFKMFLNIFKEEQWLNKQLQKGYVCTNVNGIGVYTFVKTDEAYAIRLDYQDYLTRRKFAEYKTIYQDFGWSHIKGSRFGSIQYWQKTNDGQIEIFSDRQSYKNYFKRVMNYSFWIGLLLMVMTIYFYKDSGLYLTEGLWDMEGSWFWKAFIFETPFVLLRLTPLMMSFLFGINYLKAYRQYAMLKE